ncbi:MAG TPA: hypothetical protein VFV41_12265 [Streptosporangiaceae bacterium]|nr:hypothetical protein [Streptosporangiaceae bacterium]
MIYRVEVTGAPFTCDVIASFRDRLEAGTAATQLTLRRQRSY